jgi:Skp family chaperone for outer membrane proteins
MKTARKPIALVLAAGAIVCVSLLATSVAQQAPGGATRIAVCDVAEIVDNYARVKDLNAEIQRRQQALKAEDEKRMEAARAVSMELQDLKPGSPQFEQRFQELERMRVDRKGWLELQEGILTRWHLQNMRDVYNEVVETIALVAREQGLNLVLYHESAGLTEQAGLQQLLAEIARKKVLYRDPQSDITQTVLLRLNQKYGARTP